MQYLYLAGLFPHTIGAPKVIARSSSARNFFVSFIFTEALIIIVPRLESFVPYPFKRFMSGKCHVASFAQFFTIFF